jgi:hypothetical protein
MKISNKKAIELLEEMPLASVANESNFLAPLFVKGRSVSTEYTDPGNVKLEGAKRRIADALGATGPLDNNNVWYEVQYDNSTGVHKIKGTLLNDAAPIKVVS